MLVLYSCLTQALEIAETLACRYEKVIIPLKGAGTLRILCINLDRSVERWTSIERQAKELDLSIERFAAIDGSKLNPLPDLPIPLGAIGCFLSHRGIWQIISEGEDEYVLVLEDDVLLSQSLPEFLRDTTWLPEDADIVHLGSTDRRCTIAGLSRPALGRKIYKSIKCTGTEGYIISRRCAAALYREMVFIDQEFDQVLLSGGRPDLNIYKIFPALCAQDRENLTFTIEREVSNEKKSNINKIKRESARIMNKFLDLFRLRRRASITYE